VRVEMKFFFALDSFSADVARHTPQNGLSRASLAPTGMRSTTVGRRLLARTLFQIASAW
jgi:hypothetical protein